jgi:hypothetical protein
MRPADEKTVSADGDQRFVIECGDFVAPAQVLKRRLRRAQRTVIDCSLAGANFIRPAGIADKGAEFS